MAVLNTDVRTVLVLFFIFTESLQFAVGELFWHTFVIHTWNLGCKVVCCDWN